MESDILRQTALPLAADLHKNLQTPQSTKVSVSCLQSSMVVGMSWPGAAWVLQVLESYISLRETWNPTCTVKYCSRAHLNGSKYCYVSLTIQLNINHLFTELNNQTVLFQTIQFTISHWFALSLSIKQFYLTLW